jgi:glycogen debranching enzyme
VDRDLPAESGDVIRIRDDYYILANSSLADDRTRVLKSGETFAVFDRSCDLHPIGRGQQGLYHDGTRHLRRLELRLGDERPILLSSTITEDNAAVAVDLTNPQLGAARGPGVPQDSIHVFRSAVLADGVCHHRVRVRSFGLDPVSLSISILFDADFVDIFEVRGFDRARSGERLEPEITGDSVTLGYRGLDDVVRKTALHFAPTPESLDAGEARFAVSLSPGGEAVIDLRIACHGQTAPELDSHYEQAAEAARSALASRTTAGFEIETSNEQFNDWLNRSLADLRMMLSPTPHGRYPYAGVPWFNAPFGRDGIITALETLWLDPSIAASVLRYLAANQAGEESPENEAEPGKILHEARGGELPNLGEVPFRRYYGAADTTPLFVVLAHAHFERTGDHDLLRELWPHVERALAWIDDFGDRDGDGFVEYERRGPTGLVNQGWKDSHDSVFHADGRAAEGAIALCEIQAYVFGAKHGAADLADALGQAERAQALRAEAVALQQRFEERFWSEELGSYVLALDGRKRACAVRSSNAGQCLFTGIASFRHAQSVATSLMSEEFYSGWGIRTLATGERRYNPMSYHNGSVWPHDNALIAAGLARYGMRQPVVELLGGFFDAAQYLDLTRMPELFCGFARRPGQGPTPYPVACAPQAWSAVAVFLLLQSCLGLRVTARPNQVLITNAVLPPFLDAVTIRGLRAGAATVDLQLTGRDDDVAVQVLQRDGDIDVVVVK